MNSNGLAKHIPEPIAWLRAAVSSVPVVGSALDHLLFDKADAVRLRNIEAALKAMSEQLLHLDERRIDKTWFQSEEALAAFRLLSDRIAYEPDPKKIEDMGRIVASCGETQHSQDEKKLSVVDHLSRLSHVQIKLLAVICNTPPQQKKTSIGGLEQTATAIWISDLMNTLKAGPQFWAGTMTLDEELEILESLNTIRRLQLFGSSDAGFVMTAMGKRAAQYVATARV
ncbi:MAG: hypothetical protein AB1646_10170 [Thermodesulfobacteriota bacterium]